MRSRRAERRSRCDDPARMALGVARLLALHYGARFLVKPIARTSSHPTRALALSNEAEEYSDVLQPLMLVRGTESNMFTRSS